MIGQQANVIDIAPYRARRKHLQRRANQRPIHFFYVQTPWCNSGIQYGFAPYSAVGIKLNSDQ
jgi:hypothetical protein